jgi:hypothetical protein
MQVAEVDSDGRIWRGRQRDAAPVGQVTPPNAVHGGAGFLLLDLDREPLRKSGFLGRLLGVVAVADSATQLDPHSKGYRSAPPGSGSGADTSRRELGIAHSSGVTVLFSSNPNKTFGMIEKQDAPNVRSPEEVNDKIEERISTNERRKFLVVVEGELDWLICYQRGVELADFIVYCSDVPTLAQLSVPIVDDKWKKGQEPMESIDHWLF